MAPGAIAFTRTPYGPHSTAHVRVSESTPAFAAATCAWSDTPRSSNGALMLTMFPPCSRSHASNAARDTLYVPSRSMSTTALNPFGEMFVIGAGKLPAALLTTTSRRP